MQKRKGDSGGGLDSRGLAVKEWEVEFGFPEGRLHADLWPPHVWIHMHNNTHAHTLQRLDFWSGARNIYYICAHIYDCVYVYVCMTLCFQISRIAIASYLLCPSWGFQTSHKFEASRIRFIFIFNCLTQKLRALRESTFHFLSASIVFMSYTSSCTILLFFPHSQRFHSGHDSLRATGGQVWQPMEQRMRV